MDKQMNDLSRKYGRSRQLKRVLSLICVLALLFTMNGPKLVADTLERTPVCGLREHQHGDACYDDGGNAVCGMVEHIHTDACYQERPSDEDMSDDLEVSGGDVEDIVEEVGLVELGDFIIDDELAQDDALVVEETPAVEEAPAVEEQAVEELPVYELGDGAMLSAILENTGISMDSVEEVGVVDHDGTRADRLYIEKVDGDYWIEAESDFDWVDLGIILTDEVKTIRLVGGRAKGQAEEADPAEEAAPVEEGQEAEPAEEAAPVEEGQEADPAEEAAPVEKGQEADPAEEAAPVEEEQEADPAEEAAPVEEEQEADPAEEAAPVEEEQEADPVEEAAPVEEEQEADPAEEAAPVEEEQEADPVEEAAPVEEEQEAVPVEAEQEEQSLEERSTGEEEQQTGEQAQQQTEEQLVYPAQSFEGHTYYVDVNVTAPEGAFPEGTVMAVKPIYDRATINEIENTVSDDFTEVKSVRAVDITFSFNGEEIEPLLPISVVMSIPEINEIQEAVVVHVDDEGAASVVDSEAAGDAVAVEMPAAETVGFEADAFSVYAIVVTQTIETRYIDASGAAWNIAVGYDSEAGIPSGASLAVREVTGDEAQAYEAQTAEVLTEKTITLAKFFDISILDIEGNEVQPAKPVEVRVAAEGNNDTVQAVHFDGEGIEVLPAEKEADAVTFEAASFSVYGVVYTVDFEYNRHTHRLDGGDSMRLSKLLDALEIGFGVSRVTDVQFSNPAVLSVEPMADGDWLLTSLKAFSTPETLTLILDSGAIVTLSVIDPPHGADDDETTQDITDFLIKAEIYSANGEEFIGGSEGDPATVRYGQKYKIALTFAEQADSAEMQFTDSGKCVMTYKLPDGLKNPNVTFGETMTMTIDLGDGDKLEGNVVEMKDGRITVKWNSEDAEHFQLLTDSPRTTFTLKFNATINTEQNVIQFNSDTRVDILEDDSFNLEVHKEGEYVKDYTALTASGYEKPAGKGLVKYTVTVKALDGDGKNIKIADTLAETFVLKYVQKSMEDNAAATDITMTCEPAAGTSIKNEQITPNITHYEDSGKGFKLTIDKLAKDQVATLTYYAEVEFSDLNKGRGTAEQTSNTITADGPNVHAEDTEDLEDEVLFVDIDKKAGSTEQVTDENNKTWLLVPWTIEYNKQKEVAVEGETLTDMLYSGAMDAMSYVTSADMLRSFFAADPADKTSTEQAEYLAKYRFKVWVDGREATYKDDWWEGVNSEAFEYSDEDARVFTKGSSWSWKIPALETDDSRGTGNHSYKIQYYTLVDPAQVITTDKNGNRVVGNQVNESYTGNHTAATVTVDDSLTENTLNVEKETLKVTSDYIQWQVSFNRQPFDLNRAMLVDELPNLPEHGVAKEEIVMDDKDHEIVVKGLYLEEGNVSVEPSKFSPEVIFRFFKNNDPANPVPGLLKLADQNDEEHKTITVTFWTKNDSRWVTNAVESDWPAEHWNNVTLYANSQQVSASAMGMPKEPKIVKEGEQWGALKMDIEDKKDVPLPVLKFTLTLSGLDEDWFDASGNLVVGDVYDKALRPITPEEAATLGVVSSANKLVLVKPLPEKPEGSTEDVTPWSAEMAAGASEKVDDNNNKVSFTINRSAFAVKDKNGEQVYDYGLIYKLTYYMVLDEKTAISEATDALIQGDTYTDANEETQTTPKGYKIYENTASLPETLNVNPGKTTVEVDLQPIDKSVSFDKATGKAKYTIEINPMKLRVNKGANYTVKDAYKNLSVDFKTVAIDTHTDPQLPVEYAYHNNEGVFQIPDETHVTITYYAWPVGPKDKTFTMENTASMLGFEDTVKQNVTLSSDFNGSAGVYSINVAKYADNNMADRRAGAVFQLYGKDEAGNTVPLTYKKAASSESGDTDRDYYTANWPNFQDQPYFPYTSANAVPTLKNHAVGDPIYFRTGSDGISEVRLSMSRDGLGLDMGLQYYLKEAVAPVGLQAELDNGEPLMWRFMLSDVDDFDHYIYRNKSTIAISNASVDNGLVLRKEIVGGDKLKYRKKDGDDPDEKYQQNITFLITGPNNYRREVLYSEFVKDDNGEYRFMLPKDRLTAGEYTVYELSDTADIGEKYHYTWTGEVKGTAENGGTVVKTGTAEEGNSDGVKDGSPYVKFKVTADDLKENVVLTAAFTNTYSDRNLKLTKEWADDYTGWTSKSATFKLYKNGKPDREVTLTAPNNTVTLPLTEKDSNDNAIEWSVAEVSVSYTDATGTHTISGADIGEQFAVSVKANEEEATQTDDRSAWKVVLPSNTTDNATMTFTNTHNTEGLVKVEVRKAWPNGESEGKPEVTFNLYRTTQTLTAGTLEKTALQNLINAGTATLVRQGLKLNAANSWIYEADLHDEDSSNAAYRYFALEDSVAGYAPVYSYAETKASEDENAKVTQQTLTIDNQKVEGTGKLTVSKETLGLPEAQKSGKKFAFAVTNNGKYLTEDGTFADKDPGYTVAAVDDPATADKDETKFTFNNVPYGEYTVAELNPALSGKSVQVTVTVDGGDAKEGQSCAVTVGQETTAVKITNNYEKTDYAFDKVWIGPNNRDNTALVWPNDQEIKVTVKRRDDTGADDASFNYQYTIKRQDAQKTDAQTGDVSFDAVTVTATCADANAPEMQVSTAAANVYRFTLSGLDAVSDGKTWTYFAVEDEVPGYTTAYGRADGIVAVQIAESETTDADGKTTTTVKYKQDAAPIGANGTPAAIINRVSTRPVTIPVKKAIAGRSVVKAGEFSFNLYKNGETKPLNLAPVPVDGNGNAVFQLLNESVENMTLKYVNGRLVLRGTLIYRIQEVVPTPKDPTIKYYDLPVTVMDEVVIDWETGETDHTLKAYYPDGTEQDEIKYVKITNDYIRKERDLKIQKTWNDANNQDGLRRDVTVMVKCYATETRNGTTTTYEKVVGPFEVDLRGATRTEQTAEATIRVPQYVESAPVTRYEVWEVQDEGKNDNNQTYTFPKGMPDYAYTVAENDGKVTVTVPENGEPEAALTNAHVVEKINVSVTKVWQDEGYTDRRKDVQVQLYRNGEAMDGAQYTQPLNDGNRWTCTWEALDRYTPGKVGVIARYTVKEVETTIPVGYKSEHTQVEATAAKGGTAENIIKNTYDETVEVGVKKVWDDDNNRDGKRTGITGVTMKLVAKDSEGKIITDEVMNAYFASDNRKNGIAVTGDSSTNEWTTEEKWSPLPKYWHGKEIAYTVEEDKDAQGTQDEKNLKNLGYTPKVGSKGSDNVITVTNRRPNETVTVTLTKTWDDANNQDGYRPNPNDFKGRIQLLVDAVPYTESNVQVNGKAIKESIKQPTVKGSKEKGAATTYTLTYANLPRYRDQGTQIDYTLQEIGKEGTALTSVGQDYDDHYTLSQLMSAPTVDENGNRTMTVENKHVPELITVAVQKEWKKGDSSKNYGDRVPTPSVGVTLKAKFGTGNYMNLDSHTNWSSYKTSVKQDDTNAQTSFARTLAADGWSAQWINVPKYAPGEVGQLLTYTVEETVGDIPLGYVVMSDAQIRKSTTQDTANGSTLSLGEEGKFSNTYEEIDVPVTKIWQDDDNRDGKRAAVTFKLTAKVGNETLDFKGAEWGKYASVSGNGRIDSTTGEWTNTIAKPATDNGTWSGGWTCLPKYAKGQAIVYDVTEVVPDGYTMSKTKNSNGSFTFTNTRTVDTVQSFTLTKTWDDDSNRDNKRPSPEAYVLNNVRLYMDEIELTPKKEGNAIYLFKADDAKLKANTHDNAFPAATVTWESTDSNVKPVSGTYTLSFNNLPVNSSNGTAISYTMKEYSANGTLFDTHMYSPMNGDTALTATGELNKYVNMPNPTVDGEGASKTIGFALKNKHDIDTVSVVAKKAWLDDDDAALAQPVAIKVQLYADNLAVEGRTAVLKPGSGNEWSCTWTGLPVNKEGEIGQPINYTVKEVNVPKGYVESNVDDGTLKTSKTNIGSTVTNTFQTGSLEVKKAVHSTVQGDKAHEFRFKVTLTNLNDFTTWNAEGSEQVTRELYPAKITVKKNGATLQVEEDGNKVDAKFSEAANGQSYIEFTLHDNDTVTIENLPAGVTYKVEELAETNVTDKFTTKVNNDEASESTGTIAKDTKDSKTFTNIRKTGELKITKKLDNAIASDNGDVFYFNVTVKGDDGKTLVLDNTNAPVKVGNANLTATTGSDNALWYESTTNGGIIHNVPVTLGENSDTATTTITGLPVGAVCNVSEVSWTTATIHDNIEVDSTTHVAKTIAVGTAQTDTFTNTRKLGDLAITKTVNSPVAAEQTQPYRVKVKLSPLPVPTNQTHTYIITATNGQFYDYAGSETGKADDVVKDGDTYKVTFNTFGEAYIYVCGGQTVTIHDIPTDITCTVAEDTYADFKAAVYAPASAKIKNDSTGRTASTAITNTRKTGKLQVGKAVVSDVTNDKASTTLFRFTVTLTKLNNVAVTDNVFDPNKIEVKKYTKAASGSDTEDTSFNGKFSAAGVLTVDLAHDQYIAIDGLPTGVEYTVREDSYDNFTTANKTAETGSYTTGSTVENQTISNADEQDYALFQNTRKTGSLTLTKALDLPIPDDDGDTFYFDVTLTRPETETNRRIQLDTNAPIKVGNANLTVTTSSDNALWFEETETGGIIHNVPVTWHTTETDGRSTTITGLPIGTTYSVSEKSTWTNATRTTLPNGGNITMSNATVTGTVQTENVTNTGTFTNTRKTGSLSISKTVDSPLREEKSTDHGYQLTLTLKTKLGQQPVSGEYRIARTKTDSSDTTGGASGSDTSVTFDAQGVGHLTIHHNETITISGLPTDTECEVEESTYSEFTTRYDDSDTNAKPEIKSDNPAEKAIANTRKTGGLKVSKAVVSAAQADLDTEFTFTITLTAPEGAANANAWKIADGDYSATAGKTAYFTDNIATVTLKNGDTIELANLPMGIQYTVQEADNTSFTTKSKTGQNGTDEATATQQGSIVQNQAPEEIFTNTRKVGQLTVNKQVDNALPGDLDTDFTFQVALTNKGAGVTEQALNYVETGTTAIKVKRGANGPEECVTVENGVVVVQSSVNAPAIITNIPVGTKCVVTEVRGDVTTNIDIATAAQTVEAIAANTDSSLTFTNTRKTGTLSISKAVADSVLDSENNGYYQMKVKLTTKVNNVDRPVSGTFEISPEVRKVEGDAITDTYIDKVTFNANGEAIFAVQGTKQGDTPKIYTLKNIPVDVDYSVEEINVPAKFDAPEYDSSKSGTVSVATPNPATTVTNKRKFYNLTVEKRVLGNMADTNKAFAFTLTIDSVPATGSYDISGPGIAENEKVTAGTPFTFNIKHGEAVVLYELPRGARVTVRETCENYNAGWVLTDRGNKVSQTASKEGSGTATTSGVTVTVTGQDTLTATNTLTGVVDTGLRLDVAPYIALLLLLGAAAWLARRRRQGGDGDA